MGKPIVRDSLLVDLSLSYRPGYMDTVVKAVKPEDYLFKHVEKKSNQYGQSVIAREAIEVGELVLRFRGEIKTFDEYPFMEKPYLIPLGNFLWINPVGTPRFVNHSCEPNCEIRNRIELYCIRPIQPGEEISFRYDIIVEEAGESAASIIEQSRWDHAFTFTCLCGAPSCVGVLDRNRTFLRAQPAPKKGTRKRKSKSAA